MKKAPLVNFDVISPQNNEVALVGIGSLHMRSHLYPAVVQAADGGPEVIFYTVSSLISFQTACHLCHFAQSEKACTAFTGYQK